MARLQKYINIFTKIQKRRLSIFPHKRIPSGTSDLLPAAHWAWGLLIVHLPKIACLMLFSGANAENFVNGTYYEPLLENDDKLKAVSGSGMENCDGCYQNFGRRRSEMVRSGQRTAEFEKRSMQHQKATKLQDAEAKTGVFYKSHPFAFCDRYC